MDSQSSCKKWLIVNYKEIKRSGRVENQGLFVLLNESKRILAVYQRTEELEHVYCNMKVSKYPCLKMKGPQLYVMVNNQNQGFRLTFRDEDRSRFMETIRRVAYISETPEKNHLNRTFTSIDNWGANAGVKKTMVTSSQPVSYSGCHASTSKKPAMRNLAQSYQSDFFAENYSQPSTSAKTYYSQPTHNPYTRPLSSASSISSSISSAISALTDESPFFSYSQKSCSSSYASGSQSDNMKSPYSGSQVSDIHAPSYTNLVSTSPLSWSQQSSDPFTQPSPSVMSKNKSVQTDRSMIDRLVEDPIFIGKFLERLGKSPKLANLVRAMRTQIRQLPAEDLVKFNKATNPSNYIASSSNYSLQPSLTQQTSDLEYDVFANI